MPNEWIIDVLEDHPPGTQAHMAYFRIAHLALRQAHVQARAGNQCMRRFRPKAIPHRGLAIGYGVVFCLLAVAPAVQDDQDSGLFGVLAHV